MSNLHNPPDRSQQVLVPILRSSVRVTAKLAMCKLPPMCICRTWIQFLPEARTRATRVPACRACWALSRDIHFVEIRCYSEDVYIPVPCFLSVPFHSMKPIISHMCLLLRISWLPIVLDSSVNQNLRGLVPVRNKEIYHVPWLLAPTNTMDI